MASIFISLKNLKDTYTPLLKSWVNSQVAAAKRQLEIQIATKVDKVAGKGLSTNDFTNAYKNKLDGIESGAQVNTITGVKGDAEIAYRTGNVNITPANIGAVASSGSANNTTVTFTPSSERENITSGNKLTNIFSTISRWYEDLKSVAWSGSYNDLSNKPTALKNPNAMTMQANGTSLGTYDGSAAKTFNITKSNIGLGNVENKTSETIRSEITSENVTDALGYIPVEFVNENFRRAEIRLIANSAGAFLSSISVDDGFIPTYFQFKSPLYGFKVSGSFYIRYNDGSASLEVTSAVWYDGTAFTGTSAPAVVFCKLDNHGTVNKLIILKVAEIYPDASLNVKVEGTEIGSYNGSEEKNVNITKSSLGLGNVENKSSATIRSELTSSNVTTALGYTPINKSAMQLTNQNLDAYYGTGVMGTMYYAGGGNSVTGKPSGVDNFWMWLVRTGDSAFSQLLTDRNSNLWVRYHIENSWSAWKQVVSSGMNISMLNNDKGYQTEQQVEDKINEIVSNEIGQITTFSFQIVDSLPSTGTSNHIYLVPISGAKEAENYYEEYCYINNKWELIGTTQVDLTPYAKKTDIPTALKNPNAMTLQINGASQGTYDGSAAKTYNVTKESLGLGNVENKSSATIRGEITASDIQDIGVTGVKGSSESTYRKGNVNITKANIGLSNVENKSSATIRGELTSSDVIDALGYTPTEDGNIPSKLPNPSALTLQTNGTSLGSYDGSSAKTFNITKSNIGLGNVENKSSATIRGELTSSNVTTALGFTPAKTTDIPSAITVDSALSSSSTNPVQNKVINAALANKANSSSIPTKLPNPNAMTVQANGSSLGTYDGSAAKTFNITKSNIGLGNVENKNSATIRGELTLANVTKALGYTPTDLVDAKNLSAVNLNDYSTLDDVGIYLCNNSCTNRPSGASTVGALFVIRSSISNITQLYIESPSGNVTDKTHIWHRHFRSGWGDWRKVLQDGDLPTALKNPNALTIQLNGTSQGAYDGSAAKTINVTKASIGLGNVENKSSATIRGEITASDIQDVGVIGVKGSSESAYRKGNVNLTKANIGLGNVENLSSSAILNKIEAIHVKKGLGYSPACYIQISLPISPSGSFTAKSSVRFGRKVSYEYYRSAGAMPAPSWPIGKLEEHFQIVSFYPTDSSMSMDEFNKIVSIDISSVEDMGDGLMDFVVYFEEKPSTSFYATLNIMYSDITAS